MATEQPVARPDRFGLIRVFLEPGHVFDLVARADHPRWGIAMLAPMALGIAGVLLNWQQTQALVDFLVSKAAAPSRSVEIGMRVSIITTLFANITVSPLVAALGVAIVASVYGLFRSTLVTFNRLFAIAVWASVPESVGNYLLSGVVTRVLSVEQLQAVKVPTTSLGFLAPYLPHALGAIMISLDALYIWFLVLFTIGYAAAAQRPVRSVIALPVLLFGIHAGYLMMFG